MCGRYVLTKTQKKIARELGLHGPEIDEYFRDRWNVVPSQTVPIIRIGMNGIEARQVRWGLVPFFSKGIAPKFSTINATIEKLENGPCWRGPWKRSQRCLMPAAGFYEWQVRDDGSKQPFYIHCADQEDGFGFAALWDSSKKEDGEIIESCTIITMPATPLMASIHNVKHRMPAILAATYVETWLSGSPEQAKAALKQYSDDLLTAWPVSARVNTPKNNDATLIERV
jgi:putative SOS response-associated peptidase YedK